MRRVIGYILVLVLVGVAAWVIAQTINPTTLLYQFKEGFQVTGGTAAIPIGAAPPATCTTGGIFIDTDETDDTNCTTTADNSLCLCVTTNTWVGLENN